LIPPREERLLGHYAAAEMELAELRDAAREMLAFYDAKYPKGQSRVLPGARWHAAAERLRALSVPPEATS
jgi:hypothetical protein